MNKSVAHALKWNPAQILDLITCLIEEKRPLLLLLNSNWSAVRRVVESLRGHIADRSGRAMVLVRSFAWRPARQNRAADLTLGDVRREALSFA